jgi:integrase
VTAFIRRRELIGGTRYYVIAVVNGRQRSFGGFVRKKDAEARLRALRTELLDGTLDAPDLAFSEFSARWLENYARGRVRERTANDYATIIRLHLVPAFGSTPLDEMEPATIQAFLGDRVRSGLSPRTVNKQLVVLKAILDRARIWGYIKESPARDVERLRESHAEMGFLDPGEVRRFLAATSNDYRTLFATAVFTGLRQGELLALRHGDVDPARALIYVTRTYHPVYGFGEPKSSAGKRAVHMPPNLVAMYSAGDAENLLFPNSVGKPLDQSALLRLEFYPALERAGVRRVRFHDLRHTYATLMIATGANMKLLQEQLGHESISTTIRYYGHLLPSAYEGVGAKLEALVYDRNILLMPVSRLE